MENRITGLSSSVRCEKKKKPVTRALHLFLRFRAYAYAYAPRPPPPQGINYLRSHNLIENTPEATSAFLRSNGTLPDGTNCQEPLSPRAIGDFLGSPGGRDDASKHTHRALLSAYARSFSLANATLVTALRAFLGEFRLPGEAQAIDRIMAAFAEGFSADNPAAFASSDTVYVLAFAAVMLNTDLHKGGVKRKMTRDEFAGNLRGVATGGTDVPRSLLDSIYADIKAFPLAMDVGGGGGGATRWLQLFTRL